MIERIPSFGPPGGRRAREIRPNENHRDDREEHADDLRCIRLVPLDVDLEPVRERVCFQFVPVGGFHRVRLLST
jgi:hypothetical protein